MFLNNLHVEYVLIIISEAEIFDHCSNESVVISDSGEFISKHV